MEELIKQVTAKARKTRNCAARLHSSYSPLSSLKTKIGCEDSSRKPMPPRP